ncbi:tetraspanin Tsp2 [Coprinopsis sp. MPI-PUGE-AT-0042]|nr:tetraspanin Tsp2 [Coprinopsis sp. MPI-PUGE-AT-0042]
MLSTSPSSGLDSGNVSLSVNYLPSKFSSSMLNKELDEKSGGTRRRKARRTGKNIERLLKIPKMGGGVEAFRAGESRIGEEEEEDYRHGIGRDVGSTRGSRAFLAGLMFWKRSTVNNGNTSKSMHWNRFKSALFISNAVLTIYSFSSFVVCLLLWFDAWTHVDVIRVGNRPELVISTLASSMGLFTCLVGWAGTVTNNRRFLAIYNLLLWITFVFMIIPGYITYKRRTFNLEGKINSQWSRNLGSIGRLRIQNQLSCCGYFSPFVEATVSQVCYSRSILPGCKKPYLDFEKEVLRKWYTAVFAIVPFHVIVIVVGLLCSNHVTYRFGKGMMPKRYRLSMGSMAVIMENYAQQLVEQYGTDIASSAFAHSRSQAKLLCQDLIPTVAYLDHIGSSKTMLGTTASQEKGIR